MNLKKKYSELSVPAMLLLYAAEMLPVCTPPHEHLFMFEEQKAKEYASEYPSRLKLKDKNFICIPCPLSQNSKYYKKYITWLDFLQ